jgi:hypothetical protein
MPVPPTDPRRRTADDHLTWADVAASYAAMLGFVVLFWAVSEPFAAAVAAVAVAVTIAAAQRVRWLARCVDECRALAVDLPGDVSVTVAWG